MSKLSKIAASVAVVPMLAFTTPVFAASAGTLAGGDNYQAKNLTQNGSYGDNTTATCNEVVKYSMLLSNTQFTALNNVTLTVTLPSQGGVSTATATTDLGGTSGTTDTTTVTLTGNGATQSLVSGSVELDDGNGNAIKALPDTVATSGVNIGTLNGSTNEFVNFKVNVTCTPTPNKIQVCELATKKLVTINESDFNSSKYSKDLTKCQTAPTTLVNTGAGDVAGLFAVVAVAGAFAHRLFTSRRLSRQ